MPHSLLCLILLALLAGCVSPHPTGGAWRPATTDPASGRVVAMWTRHPVGDRPVPVTMDYGMLIVWNEVEPGFFLFDNTSRAYLGTTSFPSFLASLRAMPANIAIEWIDTCTVSRSAAMPEAARERLAAALADGNRRTERPFSACYCESSGLRYPPTGPPAATIPAPAP